MTSHLAGTTKNKNTVNIRHMTSYLAGTINNKNTQ
jgi:hypothetical protein